MKNNKNKRTLTDEEAVLVAALIRKGVSHVPKGDSPDDMKGFSVREHVYTLHYYRNGNSTLTYHQSIGLSDLGRVKRLRNLLREMFPNPKGAKVIDKARQVAEEPLTDRPVIMAPGLEMKVKVSGFYRSRTFESLGSDTALHKALEWRRKQAQDIVDKCGLARIKRSAGKAES